MPILLIAFLYAFGSFFLAPPPLQAQHTRDSLYILYQNSPSRTNEELEHKNELLVQLIELEFHHDLAKTLSLMDSLVFFYRQLGNQEKVYKYSYAYRGFLYASHEQPLKALECYQAYAEVFQAKDATDAYFLIDVGNLYYSFKFFKIANKYYEEAANIFKTFNNYKGLATAYGNFSLVAKNLNNLDTAFFYIHKALELQQKYVKDSFQIAHTHHVIGRLYSESLKDYPKAIPYFKTCIQIFSDTTLKQRIDYKQFITFLPESYSKIGAALCASGQADSGVWYFEKAILLAKNLQHNRILPFILSEYAKSLLGMNNPEKAQAILQEALNYAHTVENKASLLLIYEHLIESCVRLKQYEGAVFYGVKHDSLKNLQENQQEKFLVMNEQILQLERQNTINQQQKTIAAEAQIRNVLIILLFSIFVGFLCTFWLGWKLKRQNKKIQEDALALALANQTKETLLAVIGHDLRSPFNSIFKSLQFADIQNKNNPHIQTAQQASRQAFVLLDTLMQWVSLQKEQIQPVFRMCALRAILEQITAPLQNQALLNNIGIETELALAGIETDPDMLQIILRNLLLNAVKYSPENTQIWVRAYAVEGQAYLCIENQGGQIPEFLQQTLANAGDYHQIAKNGSGLGLLLVKHFCKQLGIQFNLRNSSSHQVVSELIFPKNCLFQTAEFAPLQATIQSPKHTETAAVAAQIRSICQALQPLKIYESTRIKKILENIPADSPVLVLDWKNQLLQAIYQLNQPLYEELLKRG